MEKEGEKGMPNEKQHLTFISYSKTNRGFALELAKQLKASGFLVWLDQLDIPTGARWDDEVEKALTECEIFLVILTSQSIVSHNVKDEIGYAIDSNKRILPILLDQVNVPFRLRRFQYVDFTNKSNEEGIEAAKQLLRKLIDTPREPEAVPQPTSAPAQRPEGVRPSVPKSDPNLLAQSRVEAIRKAREKEQQERSKQSAPSTPGLERRPPQPQSLSRPKLLPMIVGATLVAILCLGGGWVVWKYIFPPTPTSPPPVPTTKVPTLVTPPTTIATTETPNEPVPTTPAPPTVTIPSDPVEFIRFYYENINKRNYDLTWSLLSNEFRSEFNSGGKDPYVDFWNTVSKVEIYSAEQTKISDNEAIVIINSSIQARQLNYYLRRNNSQSNWLFYPIPDSFNVSCDKAPKRLSVGITAEVATGNDDLLLRNAPTDGIAIEGMPPGTIVDVVDGPECRYYRTGSVFLWWWKVRSPQGNQGWIVEGYDSKDPIFIMPAP